MQDVVQYLRSLPADCDRQQWIEIGGAFKSAGGSFEIFDQWSQTAPKKYDKANCRQTWQSLQPSNNPEGAAGWLKKKAEEAGAIFSEPMIPPRSATAQFAAGGGFKSIKPGTPEMQAYISRCAANRTEAENYFCKERGLSVETVLKFRLGYDTTDRAAVIPYPGELYCVRRWLNVPPDGHGQKYDNSQGTKPVFNAAALGQNCRPVFILEGQIDALSIMDAGGLACTGQNEQSAFIALAKGSQAPGYIIVSDQDEHGAEVTAKLKAALQKENITSETAIMPPGIHDVNEFLRKQGREALAAWIAQRERAITEKDAPPEAITLRELQERIEQEGAPDPNELIKHRFLCKGGAGILAAETGCGKSSFIMQIALHWGAGLACFGFEPTRPLKILLIQAENDDRDLNEEISGICRGAANVELLSFSQIESAKDAVRIISDATHSGDGFISMLDEVLAKNKGTDLIITDPLFGFAGFDLSDQEKVSHFLRNQINPLLKKHSAAALFVHHVAKPSRAAVPNPTYNTAYSYHGSAEIINWARFAIVLERCKAQDGSLFFTLTAPKRGRRLGWETKYLRWSDEYIYWEEIPTAPAMQPLQSVMTAEAKAEQRERNKARKLIEDAEQAAELLQPGESMTAADFRRAIIGRLGVTSKDRVERILAVCIDRGFLTARQPTAEEKTVPGIRKMIERPAEPPEPPEQPEFSIAPNLGRLD